MHKTDVYILERNGSFSIESRTLPKLESNWVRLNYLYCGICGSDMSAYEHRRSYTYPLSLGHEFIAKIEAVGSGISKFSPGDFVSGDFSFRCGACDNCKIGRSHMCEKRASNRFSNRAFSQRANVLAQTLSPITKKTTDLAAYVMAEPLSCMLHAFDWAKPEPRDRVLIIGAGSLGICTAFGLTYSSDVEQFDCIDLLSTKAEHLSFSAPRCSALREVGENTYDLVFDVSGTVHGLRRACETVRPGGRLCVMSHLTGYGSTDFLVPILTPKDVSLIFSLENGEPINMQRAIALIDDNWDLAWYNLLAIKPWYGLPEAFEQRRDSIENKVVIDLRDWI